MVLVNAADRKSDLESGLFALGYTLQYAKDGAELFSKWPKWSTQVVAVISCSEIMSPAGVALHHVLNKALHSKIPYFIIAKHHSKEATALALKSGVTDIFLSGANATQVLKRISFVVENWSTLNKEVKKQGPPQFRLSIGKRVFDLLFSASALILLSPLLLLIIIAIRLESKGPVFYYSLRVGSGYRIFRFYKFRSMYQNADKRLKDLAHLNQYAIDQGNEKHVGGGSSLCAECTSSGRQCQHLLYSDKNTWCEKQYQSMAKSAAGSAFFKLKDDPRITRVGKFLRNTSIDELPQLVNVLIGDMSIVGNRPLPLYEAEKLTTDHYAQRFDAPAGITGLWQVEKRGKGEMSEEERLELDKKYAQDNSLFQDIQLIFRTIPALLQKENV